MGTKHGIAILDADGPVWWGMPSIPAFLYDLEKTGFPISRMVKEMQELVDTAVAKGADSNYVVQAYADVYSRGMKGINANNFNNLARGFVMKNHADYIPLEIKEMIHHLKEANYSVSLLSASGYELLTEIGRAAGARYVFGTKLSVGDDGRFDGGLETSIHLSDGKQGIVDKFKEYGDYDWSTSIGAGNRMHDVPILSSVTNTFAVAPDQELTDYAHENRIPIVNTPREFLDVVKRVLG